MFRRSTTSLAATVNAALPPRGRAPEREARASSSAPQCGDPATGRVSATIARWTVWLPRALRTDVRCLDGLTWPLIGALFAVAFGFSIYSIPAVLFLNGTGLHAPLHAYLAEFLGWFVRYVVQLGPVMVAVVIADNVPATGARRVAVLAIAIALGSQVQWPLRCAYEPASETACAHFPSSLWKSWTWMSQNTLVTIGFATPLALVAFSRRRDLRITRALQAAELARVDLARRTLETDLQTMQARVEPRFLLDTLADIGELYAHAPEDGERMLDELIAYLRAALPDMRAASSTFGKEATLARAYLAILRIRARGALVVDVGADTGIYDVPMPPMVLLPLLAAATGAPADIAEPSRLRIAAALHAGALRIDIDGQGPAIRDIDAFVVVDIRERLRALYAQAASLNVTAETGRMLSVRLSIPRATA